VLRICEPHAFPADTSITKMRESCLTEFDAHWNCLEKNNHVGRRPTPLTIALLRMQGTGKATKQLRLYQTRTFLSYMANYRTSQKPSPAHKAPPYMRRRNPSTSLCRSDALVAQSLHNLIKYPDHVGLIKLLKHQWDRRAGVSSSSLQLTPTH
jgi:hypothetical protein